jgi:hypothetical protein
MELGDLFRTRRDKRVSNQLVVSDYRVVEREIMLIHVGSNRLNELLDRPIYDHLIEQGSLIDPGNCHIQIDLMIRGSQEPSARHPCHTTEFVAKLNKLRSLVAHAQSMSRSCAHQQPP